MGKMEWVGKYSDYDLKFWQSISQKDKELVGYEPNKHNDGVFFI